MSAETLLSRLDGVKQTAPDRWISRCPAHDDRSPSLSIRVKSDGVILLNCLAGCGADAVLDAINLTFADLYPERLGQRIRPSKSTVPAADLLLMIDEDVLIASLAAAQFLKDHKLTADDWQRLAAASRRIGWAVTEIRKIRPWRPANVA